MRKALFAARVACGLPAAAQAQSLGIAGRIGTLGLGGEADVKLTRFIGVRGGVGTFPFHPTATEGDISYQINPPKKIMNAGVDLYPFGGAFRLSGGLSFRDQADLTAQYNGTITIGGQTYSGTQAGT